MGPYTVTYREPTAEILSDRAGTGAPITLGAVLDVEGSGERFVLRPSRNYYPSQDASLGAIGRFFEGEATSEVALDSNLGRDVWTAVQPDLNALEGPIREANRRFADADGEVLVLIVAALVDASGRLRRRCGSSSSRWSRGSIWEGPSSSSAA